jgi:hypothetical protein
MPEEAEIETRELQETIEELHEERRERAEEERRFAWTRYVALTTALLAVFAAIGALQSGTLVNEAMMLQIRASDRWNEYQSARQKDHLYTIAALALIDGGARAAAGSRLPAESRGDAPAARAAGSLEPDRSGKREWKRVPPDERAGQYIGQVNKEAQKEGALKHEAEALEKESEERMHRHHQFAQSVALIQVAIALCAVSALSRMKSIWGLGLLMGVVGCALMVMGLIG